MAFGLPLCDLGSERKIWGPCLARLDFIILSELGPVRKEVAFNVSFPLFLSGKEWLSSTELVVKHSPDYFTSQQGNSKDSLRRSTSSEGNGHRIILERMQSEPGAALVDMSPHEIVDATFADDYHWADTDSPG